MTDTPRMALDVVASAPTRRAIAGATPTLDERDGGAAARR